MNYICNLRRFPSAITIVWIFLFVSFFFNNFKALALSDPENQLAQAGITTKLGNQVDLNIALIDSSGNSRTIGSLLSDGKPLVLIPVYYKCPRLCGILLGGVAQLIKDLDLKLGSDFTMAAFSFSPREDYSLAAAKKEHYTNVLAESGKSIQGWDFFVGEKPQTQALINQIGFKVMADGDDYAHSAAIFILDKSGRISQFFTDINFPTSDVRLALVDASNGKIGNLLDRALLLCYKFDPTKGKYTWAVERLLQVLGALSILFVGGIIVRLLINEKKRLT